jgi:type I restriction enzyme, S subunit
MNQPQLFQHFETLAEFPESPAKLHELVLQLAIRGILLSQDTKDSSAQKAADATRKLADAELPEIDSTDTPFDLPKGWAWLRIGEAMRLFNGRAFKPSDWGTTGLPIVRIQNLNKPDAVFNYCGFEVDKKVLIKNDDLLISWSGTPGTSFGAFIWSRGPAVLNQHIFRAELIGDAYEKRFLRLAINGRLDEMIAKAHGGVGLQHITKGKLERIILPVPPLAEQRRIVEKVEELQALCDELETRQTFARELGAKLLDSLIHQTLNP